MKIIKFIFIYFICSLIFCACVSSKSKQVSQTQDKKEEQVFARRPEEAVSVGTDHSFLKESDIGTEIVVKGYLKINGEKAVIEENSGTKSSVYIFLLADSKYEDVYKSVLKMEGVVKLRGVLQSVKSPWNKTMTVIKIEE
ncbi:MAG: hypothetical protein HUK25_05525 [Treponema sp.]|nr:hypothetical protein [Treponema sp.]